MNDNIQAKGTAWLQLRCGCVLQCDLAVDENGWFVNGVYFMGCSKHQQNILVPIDAIDLASWLIREHLGIRYVDFLEQGLTRANLDTDTMLKLYSERRGKQWR